MLALPVSVGTSGCTCINCVFYRKGCIAECKIVGKQKEGGRKRACFLQLRHTTLHTYAQANKCTPSPTQGFTSLSEKVNVGSTVWGSTHLPQNREVMMVSSGDGTLYLYKYHYPDQRRIKVSLLILCCITLRASDCLERKTVHITLHPDCRATVHTCAHTCTYVLIRSHILLCSHRTTTTTI